GKCILRAVVDVVDRRIGERRAAARRRIGNDAVDLAVDARRRRLQSDLDHTGTPNVGDAKDLQAWLESEREPPDGEIDNVRQCENERERAIGASRSTLQAVHAEVLELRARDARARSL